MQSGPWLGFICIFLDVLCIYFHKSTEEQMQKAVGADRLLNNSAGMVNEMNGAAAFFSASTCCHLHVTIHVVHPTCTPRNTESQVQESHQFVN